MEKAVKCQALVGIKVRTKWTVSSYKANKTKPHIGACQRCGSIIHLLTDEDDVLMAPVLHMTYTLVMEVLNARTEDMAFLNNQSRHGFRGELSICHLQPLRAWL